MFSKKENFFQQSGWFERNVSFLNSKNYKIYFLVPTIAKPARIEILSWCTTELSKTSNKKENLFIYILPRRLVTCIFRRNGVFFLTKKLCSS